MVTGRHWCVRVRLVVAICGGLSFVALDAGAQLSGDDARKQAKSSRPDRPPSLIQAQVAFRSIDEDRFLSFRFVVNIARDNWGLGLQAPLRLRIKDRDPQDEEILGILRKEDWDDPPYLTGARISVTPFGDPEKPINRRGLTLGTSYIVDWRAPLKLKTGALGLPVFDRGGAPELEDAKPLLIHGIDMGVALALSDRFVVTPYTDFNKMTTVDEGWGWHTGVLWYLEVPRGDNKDPVEISMRTEYRRVSGDYVGPYFNTVYEIERFARLEANGGNGDTKLQDLCGNVACKNGAAPARNGVLFELQARLPDIVSIGSEYIAYDGEREDGSFRLSVELPAFEYFELRAFYYRINMAGLSDAFAVDDRTAIVTELRVPFLGWFSANAAWWRVWQTEAGGGFGAVDDWSIGVGLKIKLGGETIEVETEGGGGDTP